MANMRNVYNNLENHCGKRNHLHFDIHRMGQFYLVLNKVSKVSDNGRGGCICNLFSLDKNRAMTFRTGSDWPFPTCYMLCYPIRQAIYIGKWGYLSSLFPSAAALDPTVSNSPQETSERALPCHTVTLYVQSYMEIVDIFKCPVKTHYLLRRMT